MNEESYSKIALDSTVLIKLTFRGYERLRELDNKYNRDKTVDYYKKRDHVNGYYKMTLFDFIHYFYGLSPFSCSSHIEDWVMLVGSLNE